MFSLLTNESALGDPRRRWSTLASFAVQAMAVSFLLLLPLMRPGTLPRLVLMSPEVFLPPPAPPAAITPPHLRSPAATTSELNGITVISPDHIPDHTEIIDDHGVAPQPIGNSELNVAGSTGTGRGGALLQSLLGRAGAVPPVHATTTKPRPPSVIMEGHLVRRVQPEYPSIARIAGIQGAVVIQAMISKDGTIENLRVLSGHPILIRAAKDAVKQWRYRPYFLNGEPIEVETQITVNFTLSRG
jgi:periplasmic protein TonB